MLRSPRQAYAPRTRRSIVVASVMAGDGRWNVECRIAIEEPHWLERKADRGYRHDGPVLGPDHVVRTERVPDHHVSVRDRAVSGGIRGEAGTAWMLVRVIARGESFARTI